MRKIFFSSPVSFFPKHYSWLKRILAQALFLCASIVIRDRENLLTQKDVRQARHVLKRGDVVLVGNLRILFSKFVRSPVTHSMLYIGRGRFVHAMGDGVGYITYHEVAIMYDTIVILRISEHSRAHAITTKAINFAKLQVGKAYNFFLSDEDLSFFCSQLVNNAYLYAEYNTKLESRKPSHFGIDTIVHPIKFDTGILRAGDFVKGNFDVVFTSHNVVVVEDRLGFVDPDNG
jgi:hypothetical protein